MFVPLMLNFTQTHCSRCPRSAGQPRALVTVNDRVLNATESAEKHARRPATHMMKRPDTHSSRYILALFRGFYLIHNCPVQNGVSIENAYQGPFLKPHMQENNLPGGLVDETN